MAITSEMCEQVAQGCYVVAQRRGNKATTSHHQSDPYILPGTQPCHKQNTFRLT